MTSSEQYYQQLLGYSYVNNKLVEDYYVKTNTTIAFGGDQSVWSELSDNYPNNKDNLIATLHSEKRLASAWESKLYGSSTTTESNLLIYGIVAATITAAYLILKKK